MLGLAGVAATTGCRIHTDRRKPSSKGFSVWPIKKYTTHPAFFIAGFQSIMNDYNVKSGIPKDYILGIPQMEFTNPGFGSNSGFSGPSHCRE